MTKQQIGKCGELLVQYRLLLNGIESAPMTTDAGIDLVAFSSRKNKAMTIQVKTNLKPKPGGGRGSLVRSWWVPDDSPADLVACVDLSEHSILLFTLSEFQKLAQQHSSGRRQLYMFVDNDVAVQLRRKIFLNQFLKYKFETRITDLF